MVTIRSPTVAERKAKIEKAYKSVGRAAPWQRGYKAPTFKMTGTVTEYKDGVPVATKTYVRGKLVSTKKIEEVPPTQLQPKIELSQVEIEKRKLGLGERIVSRYAPYMGLVKQKILGTTMKFQPTAKKIVKVGEQIKKVPSKITSLRDAIIGAWTGYKPEEAYVPTTEEILEEQRKQQGAYYTRPTIGAEGLTPAGTPLVDVTKITAGGEYAITSMQEDVRAMGEVDFEAKQVMKEYGNKAQKELDQKFDQIQKKVNEGTLKVEEANEILKTHQDKINKKYTTLATNVFDTRLKYVEGLSKGRRKELEKKYTAAIAVSVGQKVAIGGLMIASWHIPYAGQAFKVADIAQMTMEAPALGKSLYKDPLGTTKEIAPYIVGGVLAGAAIGKFEARYIREPKIRGAIERSFVRSFYKDMTRESMIKRLIIDTSLKKQLISLLDEGKTIRVYTTELVARSTADTKYVPKVKGTYIEVLSREGMMIQRINIGSTIVSGQHKIFSNYALSQAMGRIEGDTVGYYTRTVITKKARPTLEEPFIISGQLKPAKYFETLESVKLIESKKLGEVFALRGAAEIRMLKEIISPKVGDMTKVYQFGKPTPEQFGELMVDWKIAKPYGKAQIEYKGKIVGGEIDVKMGQIGDVSAYLIKGEKTTVGKGVSFFERIMPEEVIKKPTRAWDFDVDKLTGTTKPKPTELKIIPIKEKPALVMEIPEPLKMQIWTEAYIQKLSTQQALTYESVLALTPELAKQPSLKFIVPRISSRQLQLQQLQLQPLQLQKLQQKQVTQLSKLSEGLGHGQPQRLQQLQLQQMQPVQKLIPPQPLRIQLLKPSMIEIPKVPRIPKFELYFQYKSKPKREEIRRRKLLKRKYKEQQRKYQASVAALSLGIGITEEEFGRLKKKKKRWVGTEIRPMVISNGDYSKRLNKVFSI